MNHHRALRCRRLLTTPALLLLATSVLGTRAPAADSTPASPPAAEVELFDDSALPKTPATLLQQQVRELIRHHRKGDVSDAIAIQRKLAAAYAERGDTPRAAAATQRADRAAKALEAPPATEPAAPPAPTSKPSNAGSPEAAAGKAVNVPEPKPAPPANTTKPAFTGLFYRMHDRGSLEKWDFESDGTFLHTWVGGGTGASARTSERGTFRVEGGELVLAVTKQVTAYAASTGSHQSTLGAGSESTAEQRRMKIILRGENARDGLILDGVEFKVRSWQ